MGSRLRRRMLRPEVRLRLASNGHAPTSEFLPDSRIEPIWDRLNKEMDLPEDTQFATVVQPAHWAEHKETGLAVLEPETVIFWAVAPNPQPRWAGKLIKQYAYLTMDEWRQLEMENWRYVGTPDPAYVIFREACKRLIQVYQDWKAMN
jgi:hypothetical protein